jgi:hypothetical protein
MVGICYTKCGDEQTSLLRSCIASIDTCLLPACLSNYVDLELYGFSS